MTDWNKMASNLIKAEIKRRGMTYEQLQEKLKFLDVQETKNSINTKINRGTFSFAFFLQCMRVLDAKLIRLDE